MLKYRRIPHIVEVDQYCGTLVKGMCTSTVCRVSNPKPHIHVIPDGEIKPVEIGDWIVPEPDGMNYYPVKPEVFAVNYERIDEDETKRDTT